MSKELEALDILKNRITTLSLNHKIGSRDIAKLEVKDIVNCIKTHVIPVFEQALNKLERLKKFKETFDNYELAKKQDFIAYENWIECEAELKKSPTAEEVCEALSEFMGREVSYTNKQFHYTIKDTQVLMFVTETYDNNTFSLGVYLPPHLITLIGKFYEGEIK